MFEFFSGFNKKISNTGAIAQLGERLLCTQEVSGSIPLSSTITYFILSLMSFQI
jgi:hypothetical protein